MKNKSKDIEIEYWRNDIQKWVKKLPKSFKDKLVKTRLRTKENTNHEKQTEHNNSI